jgi:hypothetical protein
MTQATDRPSLVATLAAVLLGQLDAVDFDLVDGANVNAVCVYRKPYPS